MNSLNIMNGNVDKVSEISVSDRKPIVTYAGDKDLFLSLESTLSSSLPQEAAEWRRAYGRAVKSVKVSATFVPFTKDVLPKEGDVHLIDQPMFHTYWTQCSDVEYYKSYVREDIELWMKVLGQFNLSEWMIVVVETYDFRKSNKLLPRTTVYDKVKSDFGAKHADRCLSVINPLRSESRSAGSWRGLVVNSRLLLLAAFDRILLRFEEVVREQRERRIQPGWSFTRYFLLQEELAFVLEMLGVHEEALVQYDELDALFTQFVLNSNLGETPGWLTGFQSPLQSWEGLCVTSDINLKERSRIESNTCSPLHFRNYLFSRQCALLLKSDRPAEVAERTLPFLHNCLRELCMLEVSCPLGSLPAWVFLSSVEILGLCETYTAPDHVQGYSRFTAGIWAYARQKLGELGHLCGLMPGQHPTSEQIHLAVQIFSGLGDSNTKPVEKLKRALSNHQEFCKEYLELSEFAMGTYKHIGRMRCARSLGQDLAEFYSVLGDQGTAASFLQSALLSYETDSWSRLAAVTRLRLAASYQSVADLQRYAKTCLSIACSADLDMKTRLKHYEEALSIIENSKPDPPWSCGMTDYLSLTDVDVEVHQGSEVSARLGLKSNLPVDTLFESISVAISPYKHESKSTAKHKDAATLENSRRKSLETGSGNAFLQRIPLLVRMDYQQDKSLAAASVEVKSNKLALRRQDSSHGKYRKVSNIAKADFTKYLTIQNVTISPGQNSVILRSKEQEAGHYKLGQCCVSLRHHLELLSPPLQQKVTFQVLHIPPSLSLLQCGDLLAGLIQPLTIRISSNSYNIPQGSKVKLKTSLGLEIRDPNCSESFGRTLEVLLSDEMKPNSSTDLHFQIIAHLPNTKDVPSIDHNIMVKGGWTEEEQPLSLKLVPVVSSKLVVGTVRLRKYLQVTVSCLSLTLSISSLSMTSLSHPDLALQALSPPLPSQEVNPDRKVGFLWKIDSPLPTERSPIKLQLALEYSPVESTPSHSTPYVYKCTFDLNNFKTIYLLECKVEPSRGSEFCRVSTVCQLRLKVSKVVEAFSPPESVECTTLMYEVLAEHNMWAACGRTAGVLSLDEADEQTVCLDVMPLVNGYLPLPSVRLSKYIPANSKTPSGRTESQLRLEPFSPGQVYNVSKGSQVHVISAAGSASGQADI